MLKIAKCINTTEENIDIKIVNYTKIKYDKLIDKSLKSEVKYYEFCLSGKLENDSYDLHFVIEKNIKEYEKSTKYELYEINLENIMDCYITINDVTYLDPDVNVKYCVFKDSINFIVKFNYNNEYYGYSEFKYKI